MATVNAIYQFRSDEVARLASSITVDSGTPNTDPDYAPTVLVDENPAKVAKIDSTGGSFLLAYAAKQPVQVAALIHCAADAGQVVTLQGNNTNTWATPTCHGTFTIPTWLGAGVTRWPVNPWLDVTTLTGYDAAGFYYWRVLFGTGTQNIQLGQLWLGATIRRFDPNLNIGHRTKPKRLQIVNRTSWDVETIYSRASRRWSLIATLQFDSATVTTLTSQWDSTDGRSYPWLIVPNGLVNECYLVRGALTDLEMEHQYPNMTRAGHTLQLSVEEVSRGLRPGI